MASAATPPQLNALDAIFLGLRNKNHDVRLRSAEDLKQYVKLPSLLFFAFCRSRVFQVTNAVAEMSSSTEAKMWDDTINRRLFDLVHSPNTSEKLGGILAIGVSWCYRFVF